MKERMLCMVAFFLGTSVFASGGTERPFFFMGSCDRSIGSHHCLESKFNGYSAPGGGMPGNPLEMMRQHFEISCHQGNPPGRYSATENCSKNSAVGFCRILRASMGVVVEAGIQMQTDMVAYAPVTSAEAKERCDAVKGTFSEKPFENE